MMSGAALVAGREEQKQPFARSTVLGAATLGHAAPLFHRRAHRRALGEGSARAVRGELRVVDEGGRRPAAVDKTTSVSRFNFFADPKSYRRLVAFALWRYRYHIIDVRVACSSSMDIDMIHLTQ